jgi:hypothetical protein
MGMALELAVWKEKSLKPPPGSLLLRGDQLGGLLPVEPLRRDGASVRGRQDVRGELSRTGESSSSAGLSLAGMEKYEDGDMGGGEMS